MSLLPEKTPLSGVFLFLSISFCCSNNASADNCRSGDFDRAGKVKYVIDGDTLVLRNKERIRLIGIDAPELGRGDKPGEPGARAARKRLESLLGADKRVYLQYDRQRYDQYDRTLAHVFTANGVNIQQSLLRAGLAFPLTIPPNLDYLLCYQKAVQRALKQGRGLWSHSSYRINAEKR